MSTSSTIRAAGGILAHLGLKVNIFAARFSDAFSDRQTAADPVIESGVVIPFEGMEGKMDKSDLQSLLDEFVRLEDASGQVDTLLRTRKKVLAFSDAKSLDEFYQPIFALADLVRHLLAQQKRIQDLEERQQELEEKVKGLIAEREAMVVTNQAMITCIRSIDQAIDYLETHKFKFSIYDLLGKINAVIKPDERESFEIEGSGIFEQARFSAARSAEPHMTIQRLFDAGKDNLPQLFAEDSPHVSALKQILEQLKETEAENAERAKQAQKFGIRLKVVNPRLAQKAPTPPQSVPRAVVKAKLPVLPRKPNTRT